MTGGALQVLGFGGGGLPERSLSFSGSQYLEMSGADFGSTPFNESSFGLSTWVKRTSLTGQLIQATNSNPADTLYFRVVNTVDGPCIEFYGNSGLSQVFDRISASTISTSWAHVYATFSSGVPRIYINGSEVSYSTSAYTGAAPGAFTGSVLIGNGLTGLLYQPTFFSGTLPDVSSLYASGKPKDVSGLAGLYSTLDCAGGVVTHDARLSAAWTNVGVVTTSTDTPR